MNLRHFADRNSITQPSQLWEMWENLDCLYDGVPLIHHKTRQSSLVFFAKYGQQVYIVLSLFAPGANSLPGANQPIGAWPIHSVALSLPGQFVP